LKNWRDWQSISYLIALPLLVLWCWMQISFNIIAYCSILILVVGVCCISHNHAHVPIWRSPWMNNLTDLWIGVLQGQPVFLFQPAHIASHHRYNQRLGDVTGIAQHTKHNDLPGYLMFPLRVLPALQSLRKQYLQTIWLKDRSKFWWIIAQHIPLFLLWITVFSLDPRKAAIYVVIPQLIGLHFLLASNYLQHAHAVVGSEYNHSRNFIGLVNWFWFNVGYHTAHHENERHHWTALPYAHDHIRQKIDSKLIETSFTVYFIKTLFLGTLLKKFRSVQL